MAETILVLDRSQHGSALSDSLRMLLSTQTTMERALGWFFQQSPPLKPLDMIMQDEFSFDLLVPFRDGLCLHYLTN